MMRKLRGTPMKRAGALLAAVALATTGTVVLGTTAAQAVTFTYEYDTGAHTESMIYAYDGLGNMVGSVMWRSDPYGDFPGDALSACDTEKDGYGIVGHLSTGRTATTLGHNSPYCAGPVTGNLPEGNHYDMRMEIEKDGLSTYSKWVQVTA